MKIRKILVFTVAAIIFMAATFFAVNHIINAITASLDKKYVYNPKPANKTPIPKPAELKNTINNIKKNDATKKTQAQDITTAKKEPASKSIIVIPTQSSSTSDNSDKFVSAFEKPTTLLPEPMLAKSLPESMPAKSLPESMPAKPLPANATGPDINIFTREYNAGKPLPTQTNMTTKQLPEFAPAASDTDPTTNNTKNH